MCVILQGTKKDIEPYLMDAYISNPDGCGLMTVTDGRPKVFKTTYYHTFKDEWDDLPENAEVGVHFRIGTHGSYDENNCHPFPVGSRLWIMHNGILDIPIPNKEWSDTRAFAHQLGRLVGRDSHAWDQKHVQKYIRKMSQRSNKFLFMDAEGGFHRFPEVAWEREGNVWMSNTSFLYKMYNVGGYTYGNTYKNDSSSILGNSWRYAYENRRYADYRWNKWEEEETTIDVTDAEVSEGEKDILAYERSILERGLDRKDDNLYELIMEWYDLPSFDDVEMYARSFRREIIEDILSSPDILDWVYLEGSVML